MSSCKSFRRLLFPTVMCVVHVLTSCNDNNHTSELKPKYTFQVGKVKHWSIDGIKRFNEYRSMIIKDRMETENFISNYVQMEREKLNKSDGLNVDKARRSFLEADNDLVDDSRNHYLVMQKKDKGIGCHQGKEDRNYYSSDGSEVDYSENNRGFSQL